MQVFRRWRWIAAVYCVLLVSCAGKPFEYRPQGDIPEGPGMFSGEEGGLVLYSDEKKREAAKRAKASVPLSEDEYRDFQQFQEFKHWKEANKDSAEYREFREWQEWNAYRAWKKSGS